MILFLSWVTSIFVRVYRDGATVSEILIVAIPMAVSMSIVMMIGLWLRFKKFPRQK